MSFSLSFSRFAFLFLILTLIGVPSAFAGAVFPPQGPCNVGDALIYMGDHVQCQSPIPKGAVVAFALPHCPTGWSQLSTLSGRTIIGAGESSGLTSRALGEVGGEETHTLTTDEMPRHTHRMGYIHFQGLTGGWPSYGQRNIDGYGSQGVEETGWSQPHNTMMPYLVLTYCQKI